MRDVSICFAFYFWDASPCWDKLTFLRKDIPVG